MIDLKVYILSVFSGKLIGKDEFGNRYYESKKVDRYNKKRRWVLYNGEPEASKIPSGWHSWIHYKTDLLNTNLNLEHNWEKNHQENQTKNFINEKPKIKNIFLNKKRDSSIKFFQPWKP